MPMPLAMAKLLLILPHYHTLSLSLLSQPVSFPANQERITVPFPNLAKLRKHQTGY